MSVFTFCKLDSLTVWPVLYCSAASDYRKRRKSEPSSSQVNAPSQSRAATSPKPDAYRPSSSLKKPVIRSSPSSPSRAKGSHAFTDAASFTFSWKEIFFCILLFGKARRKLPLLFSHQRLTLGQVVFVFPSFPTRACELCLYDFVGFFAIWCLSGVNLKVHWLVEEHQVICFFHPFVSPVYSPSPQLFYCFAGYYFLTCFPPSSLSPRCSLLDI